MYVKKAQTGPLFKVAGQTGSTLEANPCAMMLAYWALWKLSSIRRHWHKAVQPNNEHATESLVARPPP